VENVARETTKWKERRQHGKRDINVEIETLSGNIEKEIKISCIF
jgi:hypothetical protein